MRLKYFLITLFLVTACSLIYVWEQVEIIKLAYRQDAVNKSYKELLDRNHYLRYNLISLKSSSYLGSKLLDDNSNFEIPRQSQMFTLTLPKEKGLNRPGTLSEPGGIAPREGIILSAFKIQQSWPISVLKSYIDNQARAQDLNK